MSTKASIMTRTTTAKTTSTINLVDSFILAQDWSNKILQLVAEDKNSNNNNKQSIIKATQRSLHLLDEGGSIPFICRYRTDVIHPLNTKQIHVLCDLLEKHKSLDKLRTKLLIEINNNKKDDNSNTLIRRIETSIDKVELEDLYAPYKPASKGSISDRIHKDHPNLVKTIDDLWNGHIGIDMKPKNLKPHEAVIHLLSSKIAGDPRIVDVVTDALTRHCRISTKKNKVVDNKTNNNSVDQHQHKYAHYEDFSHSLTHLKDHQVLAIRRGVDQKVIKLSYDIDGDRMEGLIQRILLNQVLPKSTSESWRRDYAWRELCTEVIHDSWTRLLRRKCTTRLWVQKCKIAEDRARQVFENNLRNALLAPPLKLHSSNSTTSSSPYVFACVSSP